DRLLGIHRAGAALVEGESYKARLFERSQNLVALRAVHRFAEVLDIAVKERQRRDHRLRNDAVERRRVDTHHIERTDLDLLDRILLRTQRAVAEYLDGVLAARGLGKL